MISFLIFTVLIIIGVCITLSMEKENKNPNIINTDKNKEKICGVDINLSEDEKLKIARQIEKDEHDKFERQKDELISRIKKFKESSSDLLTNKILDAILNIEIKDYADYERVNFIFNNGEFRTNEEVECFDKYMNTQDKRDNYDKERKHVSFAAFFIPFIISFLITAGLLNDVVLLPVALLVAILFGSIGMIVGHNINISNAKEYCIPANDPRVLDEKHKLTAASIALIIESASMIHHSKNAVKSVVNVDSWKEFK